MSCSLATMATVGQTRLAVPFGGGRAINSDNIKAQTTARLPGTTRPHKLARYSTKFNYAGDGNGDVITMLSPKQRQITGGKNCKIRAVATEVAQGRVQHDWNDGSYSGVRAVVLHVGEGINSIQFEYDLEGDRVWGPLHGTPTGQRHSIQLNYPDEFLEKVSGLTANFVRSLTFQTSKMKHGPIGPTNVGDPFELTAQGGSIVGFRGESGARLVSLELNTE